MNGSTLTLVYDEVLDNGSIPDISDFVISGGHIVTSVTVVGNQVVLTISPAVTYNEVITINYTPGLDPIRDLAGNNSISLSLHSVNNLTPASGGGIILPTNYQGGAQFNSTGEDPLCYTNSSGNFYRL